MENDLWRVDDAEHKKGDYRKDEIMEEIILKQGAS